jgi:hypothetical protein
LELVPTPAVPETSDAAAERELYVAGGLTDLELLQRVRGPAVARDVAAAKSRLVTAGAVGTRSASGQPLRAHAAGSSPVSLEQLAVTVYPAGADFSFDRSGGFDPQADQLTAQWYVKAPGATDWQGLPELSGPVESLFTDPAYASGSVWTSLDGCMPQGRYRVDLYVNGGFAGSAQGSSTWKGLTLRNPRDVGASMCVPAGWKPLPTGRPYIAAFRDPKGTAGAGLVSLDRANAPGPVDSLVDSFVAGFIKSYGLRRVRQVERTYGPEALPLQSSRRLYSYRGGSFVAAGGLTDDHRVVLAVAFGADRGRTQQIIDSITPR